MEKTCHTQLHKFTVENVSYYASWVRLVRWIPWQRLKFLDESHFKSQDLYLHKVIRPQGTCSYMQQPSYLNDSFSLTLLTDPSNSLNPFFIFIRHQSNDAWGFIVFLISAIAAGRLRAGDVLVADNASIHFAEGTWALVLSILAAHRIWYVLLPKYSPELNPCEFCFGFIKDYI